MTSINRRLILLLAVVLGGSAALSWEIIWQNRISLAFGSSALGTSITLACMSFGMGLGTLISLRFLPKVAHRFHAFFIYGILEFIIGVSGWALESIFAYLETLDTLTYAASPELATPVQFIGVLLAIFPASAAMGATIPVFASLSTLSGIATSTLYAANTVGAAVGILLATFWGLPQFGMSGFSNLLFAVNCLVLALSVMGSTGRVQVYTSEVSENQRSYATTPLLSWRTQNALAFLSGFVVFGLEVIWFRALKGALWSTTQTFGIILFAALVSISLGAAISSGVKRIPWVYLFASGLLILIGTPILERYDLFILSHLENLGWGFRYFVSQLLLLPAFTTLSVSMPWLLNQSRDIKKVGKLYFSNTAGGFLGAICCGWILLPTAGLSQSAWILGSSVCIASFLIIPSAKRALSTISFVLALLFAYQFHSGLGKNRIIGTEYYEFGNDLKILRHFDGPDVTTSVIELPEQTRILFIDGFAMAIQHEASRFMKWMAFVPALLRQERISRGLVICFGTGQTLHAVRQTGADWIDMVDINPKVFQFADEFSFNNGVIHDPNVHKVVMDGRAWIRRTDHLYDLITLEPPAPNFAGVNNLYSKEFYILAKERLTPTGVMTQWLPSQIVTSKHSRAIVKSFIEIFPNAVFYVDPIWEYGFLVGTKDGSDISDPTRFTQSYFFGTVSLKELNEFKFYDTQTLLRYSRETPPITDDNQLLAYDRDMFKFLTDMRPPEEILREFDESRSPN